MFSAFHYNANRGDKRFRQMYKSGEKRPDWNRDLAFEDSVSRARNSRYQLVEKFRQIQSQLTEEEAEEPKTSVSQDEDSSQEETFTTAKDRYSSSSKDIYSASKDATRTPTSFKEFGLPSSSRPISTAPISTGRLKPRGSVSAFDSNSCEGFDYSGSFKNPAGDNFKFNIENYKCSSEDIFDSKNYSIDDSVRDRLREVWDPTKNDYHWNWDDNQTLLCPGCVQNYMKLKDSSLVCENCTLQIDLSSPSVTIKMIKEKVRQKLELHKKECKERVKYKFKEEKLYVGCKHCNKEFYIN